MNEKDYLQEQPNYYAILTADVRYDKRLSANAKLLYAEITALSNSTGYCWANDSYFAGLYDVSERSVKNWISQLEKYGYLARNMIKNHGNNSVEKRVLIIKNSEAEKVVKKTSPRDENNFQTWGKNFPKGGEKNFTHNITSTNTKSNTKREGENHPQADASLSLELIVELVKKYDLKNTNPEVVFNHLEMNGFKNKSNVQITQKNIVPFLKNWNIRENSFNPKNGEEVKPEWLDSYIDDLDKWK